MQYVILLRNGEMAGNTPEAKKGPSPGDEELRLTSSEQWPRETR